jgi:hypothetical protein
MFQEAVARLRQVHVRQQPEIEAIINARDEVIAHYQPMFSLDKIPTLTADDFQSFLLFKNNKHWTGLHRQGPRICQDMGSLQSILRTLHNKPTPIEARWETAIQGVRGLGKATLSAVLHIMFPEEYGVWNRTSEASLKEMNIWPNVEGDLRGGPLYRRINELLLALAKDLDVDLWTPPKDGDPNENAPIQQ